MDIDIVFIEYIAINPEVVDNYFPVISTVRSRLKPYLPVSVQIDPIGKHTCTMEGDGDWAWTFFVNNNVDLFKLPMFSFW